MTKPAYPIAALYPPEVQGLLAEDYSSLAQLPDLQALVRLKHHVLAAQQAISQIDLHAAIVVTNTLQVAELLKLMRGWSPQLEEYDRVRREQYLQTMHQLITLAHAQILDRMKGR